MKADYVQRGESIDYVNLEDKNILAGTVIVLGKRIGITGCDIAPNSLGSVHTVGVFSVQKASPLPDISIGDIVYYSIDGAVVNNEDAEVVMGWAVEPSPSIQSNVKIKIG